MAFRLMSSAFAEGGWIPVLHSCQGADLSPALEWSGEPSDTRSFTLIVDDPDAPAGNWCHWLLYDVASQVHNLAQGYKPGKIGLSGANDFGKPGYGGPCPPEGDHPHRYLFTVFAVKTDKLDVKADTSAAVVGFNLHFNTLARAEIMGLFKR